MESEYRVCPQYGGECLTQIVVLNKDAVIAIFTKVISASLTDSLSGECTFEFSVTATMAANITTEYEVRLINDKTDYSFNIARMSKSLSGGLTICDIICEHKSYELNDEKYNLTEFNYSGSSHGALAALLDGTPLSAGECDISLPIDMKINQKCSRRAALMQLVGLSSGEIEYSGDKINIRTHRGSVTFHEVMGGKNVSDLTVNIDTRAKTATYGLTLYKKLDLGVGDNVHIVFRPFNLDVQTRIVSMTYNPFNLHEITIEVGDYFPSISDKLYKIEKITDKLNNEVNNMSDSTASMKIGTNGSAVTVDGYEESVLSIPYTAVKSTYAAFCATVKFTVSTAGCIEFVLKKDENEVIRYSEYYSAGSYTRTYSYPFASLKGLNVVLFSVMSPDGAAAVLPKMQTWGYVLGAYLAGDEPWDGRIRLNAEFVDISAAYQTAVTESYVGNSKVYFSDNIDIAFSELCADLKVPFICAKADNYSAEFILPIDAQYAYYIDSYHLGVKFGNPVRESSVVLSEFAAMGGVEGNLRSVEIVGITVDNDTLIIETAGFDEYDSAFLVGYSKGSLISQLDGRQISEFSLPFSKEDIA